LENNSPKAHVTIDVLFKGANIARSIMEAISPDNIQSPEGVVIETRVKDSELHITISCVGGIKSLIATLDDLLSCIQAAERALLEIVE
jgi:hypothetical protein